jgi:O-acetyl-ADP-ribose deacetylase (regulator of RNase III)
LMIIEEDGIEMPKGKYQIIQGDVTDPVGEGIKIIPHIISDLGVCGAGVAKAIVKKWPNVLVDIVAAKKDKNWGLGLVVKTYEPDVVILSMIAQEGLRSRTNPSPIKYAALKKCMNEVFLAHCSLVCLEKAHMRNFLSLDVSHSIHCPKFGSGLAGGDWDFIEKLIQEIWVDNGIDVTVYEY